MADRYDRFAFFYDMGTGKTAMALNIVSNKYQKYGSKFLIIAPLAVINTAWMDDQKTYFPDMRILPLHQSFKQDRQKELLIEWRARPDYPVRRKLKSRTPHREMREELEQYAQHYIINPELFINDPSWCYLIIQYLCGTANIVARYCSMVTPMLPRRISSSGTASKR